ncbi:MAG: hypothetical protein HY867_20795 [Chloroflexi bacterium]|nr:hypothetical protein [Chloroflexota bacterium]
MLTKLITKASEFLAHRKGLLPLIGLLFILANLLLQFLPSLGWLSASHLLLHIGLIIAIFGLMLAWAL